MNRKVKSFKQMVFPQVHNDFATCLLSCRERVVQSAHKSAVRVCQITTVVMEAMQLVLSQFKDFLL